MRCAVTGAAGFIGSHLTDHLVTEGHQVLATDVRTREGSKVPVQVEDVMEPDFTELLVEFAPEVVFHMAGQGDAGVSWLDPVLDAELNVVGTLAAYQAARVAGAQRFVFPSTWMVYQGALAAPPWPVGETRAPRTPYGASKLAAETCLKVLANSGDWPAVRVAVLGNVYGPRDTSVVSLIARMLRAGKGLTLNANAARDFVHVDDVVRALVAAGEHEGDAFERAHVSWGKAIGLTEVARMLGGARIEYGPVDVAALDDVSSWELWGWQAEIELFMAGLDSVVDALEDDVT